MHLFTTETLQHVKLLVLQGITSPYHLGKRYQANPARAHFQPQSMDFSCIYPLINGKMFSFSLTGRRFALLHGKDQNKYLT